MPTDKTWLEDRWRQYRDEDLSTKKAVEVIMRDLKVGEGFVLVSAKPLFELLVRGPLEVNQEQNAGGFSEGVLRTVLKNTNTVPSLKAEY